MKLLDETIPKTMALAEAYMNKTGKIDNRIAIFFRNKELHLEVALFSIEKELLEKTTTNAEEVVDRVITEFKNNIANGSVRYIEFVVMNCEAILTEEGGYHTFYVKDLDEAPTKFKAKEVILSYGMAKNGEIEFKFKEIQRIMNFNQTFDPTNPNPQQNLFQLGPLDEPTVKVLKYEPTLLKKILNNL